MTGFKSLVKLTMCLLVPMLLAQSCANDDFYNFNEILFGDIETIKDYLDSNGKTAVMDTASGIFVEYHTIGSGYKPLLGGTVHTHYAGFTLDGDQFTTTDGRGGTIAVELGTLTDAGMTEGLHYGISIMKEADSVTLYIPSVYAFKDQGTTNIPPNTIIKYNVKLREIDRLAADNEQIDLYMEEREAFAGYEEDFVYGTRYMRHKKGTGTKITYGKTATIYYVGQLLDETEFDSNYDSFAPWDLNVGNTNVIPGFEKGLLNLYGGDSATFFVPSTYAYKDQAVGSIPANSILVFAVKVVDVTSIQN